jgi:UPF0716 protein FxsA
MRRGLALAPLALAITAVVEIASFVLLARVIGFGWAALGVLTLSLFGMWLLRREGGRAWRRFRDAAGTGQPPGDQVTDGLVGLGGALLLAVPGYVTGLVGLVLLASPVRTAARAAVRRTAERLLPSAAAGDLFGPRRVRVRQGRAQAAGPTIEGEIIEYGEDLR